MSELIDQLRNLRALAYKKLTESPDYKVLTELDQMLARLDPTDQPVAGTLAEPSVSEPVAEEQDGPADDGDEAAEDPEAAQPAPTGQPPPEPEREEILLATADLGEEPAAELDVPEPASLIEETADDVIESVTPSADDGPDGITAEIELTPDEDAATIESEEGDVTPQSDMAVTPTEHGSEDLVEAGQDDSEPSEGNLAPATPADEEALIAEALAGQLDVSLAQAPDEEQSDEPRSMPSEDDAAALVAAALDTSEPPRSPAPVTLAPEENFDAAAPAKGESTDEAYDNALNRLNALIERASNRLRGDDNNGSGDATVA